MNGDLLSVSTSRNIYNQNEHLTRVKDRCHQGGHLRGSCILLPAWTHQIDCYTWINSLLFPKGIIIVNINSPILEC